MPLLGDRVQESTTTGGTGTLTLAGAVTGYRTFNSVFSNGDVVYYTIDDGTGNWEVGYGTVGTGTLTRSVVLDSSNAGSLVSFAAGTAKRVFCTAPTAAIFNQSTGGTVNGALTVTGTTTLATSLTGLLKGTSGVVSTATSGTDYAPATSGTSILYGNGSGGFSNVTVGSGLTFSAGTLSAAGGSGTVTSVSGTGTVSGISLSGTVTSSGSLTLGGSLNLSSPPAIGGTTPNTGSFTSLTATGAIIHNTTTNNQSYTTTGAGTITLTSGTAGSINNFNIGATTAGTGAFTTLSASSTVTLSGGTANGVLYLNGSKVATSGTALVFDGTNFSTTGSATATALIPSGSTIPTNGMFLPTTNTVAWSTNSTERLRLDSSGNLGLGVTPSAWSAGRVAIQLGGSTSSNFAGGLVTALKANTYYNGGDFYTATGFSSQYVQSSGTHAWYTAPSGTAGNAISFTQAMTLDASGNLLVGITAAPSTKSSCIFASSLAGSRSQSITIAALNTSYDMTQLSAAFNGIIVVRDNTTGGSAVFLQDPNTGAVQIASSLTGGITLTITTGAATTYYAQLKQTAGATGHNFSFMGYGA